MSKFIRVGSTNNSQVAGDRRTRTMLNIAGNTVPSEYWADTGEVDSDGNQVYANNFVQVAEGARIPNYPFIVLEDGSFKDTTTDKELFAIKKEQAQNAVLNAVQAIIESYNTSHGLSFLSVDSCPKYTFDPSYEHYQFCLDIIAYNLECWKYIRGLQSVVLGGGDYPTEEEFYNNFPEYTGVV